MRRNQDGFTLVEMVVVCAAAAILLASAIISIGAYSRHARFKRENEYAKTLFTAAQAQLAENSRMGTLGELSAACAGADVPLQSLRYDGGSVSATEIWQSADPSRQGRLCSLTVERGDYARYGNGTLTDAGKTALFELLDASIYQKEILNAAICVELDPEEGLVYAVLYSDEADSFAYGTSGGTVNICDRTDAARKACMVGYYGVDTLSVGP